jgi:uncharacterized membrane protein
MVNKKWNNEIKNRIIIVIIIFIIALIPRLSLLQRITKLGLGVDELQSAIHSFLPVDQLLKSVQSFDPHPPLFYLQLHIWEKLGTSDLWLRLNPVLWSVLAILSLLFLGTKVFGFRTGVIASIFLALSPFSIAYSMELRMYSLQIFLSIWIWYFTHQYIYTKKKWAAGVGILVTTLAFLYSQGAAFIIFPCGIVYVILFSIQSWKSRYILVVKYLALQGFILILYIPWLIRARTIHLSHPVAPEISDIAQTLAHLLFGTYIISRFLNGIFILASFTFVFLIIIFLFHKSSRIITLSFIIAPLVSCFFISYLIEPIWLTRTLAQVSPFLCLGLGLFINDVIQDYRLVGKNRVKFLFEVAIASLFAFESIFGIVYIQFKYYPWSPTKGSVELIRSKLKSMDVVYIPNERLYWAWSWYYFGPGLVTPLTTNYEMSKDGVTFVSRPSVNTALGQDRTWWIVYRDTDDLGTLKSKIVPSRLKNVSKFYNVRVDRFRLHSKDEP